MIRIEPGPWREMVAHAELTFPAECCGAMLGVTREGVKSVTVAIPLENVYQGGQEDRYEIRPEDLLAVDRRARAEQLEMLGIFHSHPDCDAYFSKTDLEHSCPWYSFLVLSVKGGRFDHANSFLPNAEQTEAAFEPLEHPR